MLSCPILYIYICITGQKFTITIYLLINILSFSQLLIDYKLLVTLKKGMFIIFNHRFVIFNLNGDVINNGERGPNDNTFCVTPGIVSKRYVIIIRDNANRTS